MANDIRPPSSSPAGILLRALTRSPVQAHKTSGLIDSGAPSFRALPRKSFAAGHAR